MSQNATDLKFKRKREDEENSVGEHGLQTTNGFGDCRILQKIQNCKCPT